MTARHTLTEPAATAAIDQGCRMLRLPTIRDRFADIAAAAEREQLTTAHCVKFRPHREPQLHGRRRCRSPTRTTTFTCWDRRIWKRRFADRA